MWRFSKTYPSYAEKNKISIAKLDRDTGLGNATIRGWARSSPTVDKLKAVADYFGVTVDELLQETEPITRKEAT